jgi:chaperonin cofactor prefoldin
MASKADELRELKTDLKRALKFGRAACKGDPEALRDHEDRVENLRSQISALEKQIPSTR